MIKFVLRLLYILRPIFRQCGIHYEQMSAIVAVKLTVDNRIDKSGKNKQNASNTLFRQAILMSVIGTLLFVITYFRGSLSMTLLIFHSYLCIVVITSFMSEYSRLLFAETDTSIIERFPVNNRTVLSARIISMLSYLYLITLSLSFFPYLILIFRESFIGAQLFLLASIFNTLFSLLLANLFYIGLMRFMSAEKFQQIIAYVQTLLIIIIAFSYHYAGNAASTQIDWTEHTPLWIFFTPSSYFMAFTEAYRYPDFNMLLLAGLGIMTTLLLSILTLFCFSDGYIKKASAINKVSIEKKQTYNERLACILARICCWDFLQQSGFMLTWRMTRNNLKFKQSILPMIIYALIFVGMPLYQIFTHSETQTSFATLLTPLYMLPFICVSVILNLNYSEQSNLFWIYQSRPLKTPGAILLGSLKAIYLKYCSPFFLIAYLTYGIFFGIGILPDLLLIFSFSTLFIIIYYRFSNMVFPFTKERNSRDSGGRIIQMLGTMLLLVFLGIIHYLLTLMPFGVILFIPISWILIYIFYRQIFSISLTKIESHYGGKTFGIQ